MFSGSDDEDEQKYLWLALIFNIIPLENWMTFLLCNAYAIDYERMEFEQLMVSFVSV